MGIPSWLNDACENTNLELARMFAIALLTDEPYSRETLSRCYYSIQTGDEAPNVSELWIDHFWTAISDIHPQEWRRATGASKSFTHFVHTKWGK
ncbi:hypothetical protein [Pandoraea terrigena]|uniref:Uncharacterized protein n=1 Tax=Pandoraea terrigena TaxID=2508292 RepID=A0A5E4RBR8_9BURK|nr:hypothetical protein [Pandoraea terrigena]VVD60231.1 hypothetical protein PTE31013_00061 [Pandoraea terrigena]